MYEGWKYGDLWPEFHHEEKKRTTENPLMPILKVFRLNGRMPLSIDQTGTLSFQLMSWPCLYCGVVMVAQLGLALYYVHKRTLQPEGWSSFEGTISSVTSLVILTTVTHPVFFTWRDTPHIARAINRWKPLNTNFERIVKLPVSTLILDHPICWIFLITLYSLLVEYLPVLIQEEVKDFRISIILIVTVHYITFLGWFWLVFTHLVSRSAQILKESLVKRIQENPTATELRRHRELWHELDTFTSTVADAISTTLRAWISVMVLSFVLSLYVTSMSLISGESVTVHTTLTVVHTLFYFMLLHNASYLADVRIGREFMVGVLLQNLQKLSVDQLNEIELLLYSIENSNKRFFLSGMVHLTRSAVLDIIGMTLTILVVLVQFKTSTH